MIYRSSLVQNPYPQQGIEIEACACVLDVVTQVHESVGRIEI